MGSGQLCVAGTGALENVAHGALPDGRANAPLCIEYRGEVSSQTFQKLTSVFSAESILNRA